MLVVLASGTGAQRLKKLLFSNGIPSDVIQTPKVISDGGCTYSLRLNEGKLKEVISLADANHIGIRGIFTELTNSNYKRLR